MPSGPSTDAVQPAVLIDLAVDAWKLARLFERVVARLAKPAAAVVGRRGLHKRDWSKFGDNVVPLFRPAPQA